MYRLDIRSIDGNSSISFPVLSNQISIEYFEERNKSDGDSIEKVPHLYRMEGRTRNELSKPSD